VIDGFFEVDWLLQDGIRERPGVTHANPVNHKCRVTLTGGIRDCRVHTTVVAGRVAQARPVEFVLGETGHEILNDITAVRSLDCGLAEARNNGPSICCWNERVDGVGITKDSLNEGRDGSRVAAVEADRDRKDLIGGCGRKGYA